MSLNTRVQQKNQYFPERFYSVYMLGMFFPGLTTYQKPEYPPNKGFQPDTNWNYSIFYL